SFPGSTEAPPSRAPPRPSPRTPRPDPLPGPVRGAGRFGTATSSAPARMSRDRRGQPGRGFPVGRTVQRYPPMALTVEGDNAAARRRGRVIVGAPQVPGPPGRLAGAVGFLTPSAFPLLPARPRP